MGFSPFQVVYDRSSPTISSYLLGTTNIEAIDTTLLTRDEVLSIVKHNWEKAQWKMKATVDQHRRDYSFSDGYFGICEITTLQTDLSFEIPTSQIIQMFLQTLSDNRESGTNSLQARTSFNFLHPSSFSHIIIKNITGKRHHNLYLFLLRH